MDFLIIDGDTALFDTAFPPATVLAPPGIISGSSRGKVNSLIACADGDEASVIVAGASYFTPTFPIPGVGTLTIESLAPDQKTRNAKSGGRTLILKGSKFRARLQVNVPAQVVQASGPVPDPVPVYSGTGSFLTTNTRVKMQ